MLEMQIAGKKKSPYAGYAFYTDFDKQNVGDKFITDQSPNNIQLAAQGNTTNNFGVYDHPTIGRCFQFNGTGFLGTLTNLGTLANISQSPFLLEVGLLKPNKNLENIVGTGNYATTASAGFGLMFDQSADSFQLFLMRSTSSYSRIYIPGTQDLAYNEYSVTKTATTTTARNITKNTQGSDANFTTTIDTYFSVGGSMDAKTTNILTGFIKYLRVKKM